ncbi:MAG: NUDIX domain-containing protein [Chloroflexi bacterium]|nr:NUDIX domain-containing protein [Chloroflexota bacterium]
MRHLDKVTAFITRHDGDEVLLFEHPYAGIQIPAGTVEEGEPFAQAALREAREESGLNELHVCAFLDTQETRLPDHLPFIARTTRAYARPDAASFNWVQFRRGIQVTAQRRANGFTQVTYQESDDTLNPQYITFHITAWVADDALADTLRRHFFHLEFRGASPDRWRVQTDNHMFTPFWARCDALPPINPPQDAWLDFLTRIR